MKGIFPIDKLKGLQTPFYYYDMNLLNRTLETVKSESEKYGYVVHYAVKANANKHILSTIRKYGLGADCVSGGEINAALEAGFCPDKIVFAGVGKADWEINLGLDNDIFCFNVESLQELEVINQLAAKKGKIASVALRINPDVNPHTHQYITTGLKENKFGIALSMLDDVVDELPRLKQVKLIGIHFHIGSQITETDTFATLCKRVIEIQSKLIKRHLSLDNVNFGGGLGIDYQHPNTQPIPDFKAYFETFNKYFKSEKNQKVHFEPGRSIVAQCGSLISKVLYVKRGESKEFVILDAGFTDLIRPALYDAFHKIENITSDKSYKTYDVVGPICESSDCFAKSIDLNETLRGDLVAIRSAGAYGEIMASQYNCRRLPGAYYSDSLYD